MTQIFRVSEDHALAEKILDVILRGWTRFLVEDPVSRPLWNDIFECFPEFHFGISSPDGRDLAAVGMTAPLAWDGPESELLSRGWHWALRQSLEDFRAKRPVRTLCALNAVVAPPFRGQGYSEKIVTEMKNLTESHGFNRFIAPLRPTQKERYPLTPIEQYALWRRSDGEPFDSWLRVQKRCGCRIIGTAPRSIVIEAPLSSWREWTELEFFDSGKYILPGGAVPLEVDIERGVGTYTAPSIWIAHDIPRSSHLCNP
ncbi:MAG: hypothetical protein Q4D38_05010 [Planctomycetia bacterium]|nr:hypothetical protein [Planctomycetia bacterium]